MLSNEPIVIERDSLNRSAARSLEHNKTLNSTKEPADACESKNHSVRILREKTIARQLLSKATNSQKTIAKSVKRGQSNGK